MTTAQHELVLVIDFGAQYSQLIARRVRECGVYCEIIPYSYSLEQIKAKNPQALILSGGPSSVYAENTPQADPGIFNLGLPVLGICYCSGFVIVFGFWDRGGAEAPLPGWGETGQ